MGGIEAALREMINLLGVNGLESGNFRRSEVITYNRTSVSRVLAQFEY